MSEKLVTLRHDQVCDLCHRTIPAGEKAYLVRDDFWPMDVLFEHRGGCPESRTDEKAAEKNISTASNKE